MKAINILSMRKTSVGALDTISMISGVVGTLPNRTRGFIISTIGSINPTTSAIYGNAAIYELSHDEASSVVTFQVAGLKPNSGWTKMTVNSTDFTLASAVYTQSGGNTYWQWSTATNPFGGSGAARTVVFT